MDKHTYITSIFMNIMLPSFFLIAGNICFFVSLTAALEGKSQSSKIISIWCVPHNNQYEISVPREFDSFILGCAVTDGANNGTECVFPFIYNNTKYNGCILEANSEFSFEIESWCSTEVKLSL